MRGHRQRRAPEPRCLPACASQVEGSGSELRPSDAPAPAPSPPRRSGEQVILLRKGGIREKGFKVTSRRFALYPSAFHNSEALLQPWAAKYVSAPASTPGARAAPRPTAPQPPPPPLRRPPQSSPPRTAAPTPKRAPQATTRRSASSPSARACGRRTTRRCFPASPRSTAGGTACSRRASSGARRSPSPWWSCGRSASRNRSCSRRASSRANARRAAPLGGEGAATHVPLRARAQGSPDHGGCSSWIATAAAEGAVPGAGAEAALSDAAFRERQAAVRAALGGLQNVEPIPLPEV